MRGGKIYYIILFGFFAQVLACHGASNEDHSRVADTTKPVARSGDRSLTGDFAAPSRLRFDSVQLDGYFKRYPAFRSLEKDVRSFYRMRGYSYAWYDQQGITEQAANLYNRVRQLPAESPGDSLPYRTALDSLMEVGAPPEQEDYWRGELMLSSAYFYFAERVWSGIDAAQSTRLAWYIPRKQMAYGQWLQEYADQTDSVAALREPVFRQYNLLRGYLHRYRDLEQKMEWKPLRPTGKREEWAKDPVLMQELRRRLALLGDLDSTAPAAGADSSLVRALRQYQQRMGLIVDGIIGESVLRSLNTPLKEMIRRILVNMERSRWLPDTAMGDYLAVNIPEFRLHAYHDDSLLWDMRVVVGKSMHKTVIFSGTLQNIVFSPYWNVPPGILKKEVLPGIAKDRTYLDRHHMERYANGVRQKPGPWNSLGGIKFLFPNSHNIYLHDSPQKDLFNEKNRAFSHGCIRVSGPADLATWLLRDDNAWTPQRIQQAMHAGREQWVNAPANVRVFIVYFTAWVDRQGRLNFRNDIYGRDKRLAALIEPSK